MSTCSSSTGSLISADSLASTTNILHLNVFVRDQDDYVAKLKPLVKLFRAYFGGHYPAMALFEITGLFHTEALIELEGFAVLE